MLKKVVIWMNIPSHHQSDFFRALDAIEKLDLQIRYFERVPKVRKELGWNDFEDLPMNQRFVNSDNVRDALISIDDWQSSIHIVPGFSSLFLRELLTILINNKVKWIHWSERSGKALTKLLNYNYRFIKFIKPLYFYVKGYKKYANKINTHGLGAFAISKLAKEDFISWGVKTKKIKILNYALGPLNTSTNKIDDEGLIFLYLGALTEHKGIEVLIKSFSNLNSKNSSARLILIGKDYSNGAYLKLVKERSLSDRIEFLGTINNNDINAYLSKSSVFILPTLFDGWGAVLNEAASLSKPLISTNECGAAYHLIRSNENGFRIKANSVIELEKAMQFYIDNPEVINKHGRISYDIFLKNTPERNAKLFMNNINELLNE